MNRLPVNGVTQPPISLAIIGACAIVYLLQAGLPISLALWPVDSGRFLP